VVTANHFWADGIVAVAVLIGCGALERLGRRAVTRWTARTAGPRTPADQPDEAPVA
jgi:hypothetical protein